MRFSLSGTYLRDHLSACWPVHRLALAFVSSLACSSMASADELKPAAAADPYIAVGGFYLVPDDKRDVNFGLGVDAAYGWQWTDPLWLEVHASSATLDRSKNMGTDFYLYGAGINLQYAFGNRDELTPYLLAGAGASYNDVVPSRIDGWNHFIDAGAGLTKNLLGFENLRWRVEAQVIYDNFMGGLLDYRVSAGLEFSLQKKRPAPEPQVREVVREVVKEVVREVPVPTPVTVVKDVDSDGDGVIDSRDKCPDTPKGAKVDGDGCVIEQTLTFHDVTFETNSARLTMNGRRLLDSMVAFLRSEPGVTAVVEGHTDNRGSDGYNLKLSQARAESVRAYLIEEGIGAKRLEARGFGKRRPMASNDTDAGREANRRVEFVLRKAQ
ncbi:MAG TPA: OmpA family protein [Moraxellaceae bacterium]|nr:OmpA family protein [Moraxellaceae bacterium]